GGLLEPGGQYHLGPALTGSQLAAGRDCLALHDPPANAGQPVQASLFEVVFLHSLRSPCIPLGQYAAERLPALAAAPKAFARPTSSEMPDSSVGVVIADLPAPVTPRPVTEPVTGHFVGDRGGLTIALQK